MFYKITMNNELANVKPLLLVEIVRFLQAFGYNIFINKLMCSLILFFCLKTPTNG